MFSIFSTLKEALLLWIRLFWFLVALSLVTSLIEIAIQHAYNQLSHYGWSVSLPLYGMNAVILTLIDVVKATAIFGLLKKEPSQPPWPAIGNTVALYWKILFGVRVLLVLIAILFVVIIAAVSFALSSFVGGESLTYFALFEMAIFFLFAKYALADPLVIVEKMNAQNALRKSWEMTRGHFWYVVGCYLFLGLGLWAGHYLLWRANLENTWDGAPVLFHFGFNLTDHVWVLLAWCMYLRIKTADGKDKRKFPEEPFASPLQSS